jgi:hypothetical protein
MEEINKEECIGNSLVKINDNFTTLDNALCQLSSAPLSAASIENIGADGVGLYKEGTEKPFKLRNIASGTPNVIIDQNDLKNTVTVSVYSVSAVNVGTGSGSVLKNTTQYPLSLRTIKAGANVAVNTVNDDVIISLETPVSATNIGTGQGKVYTTNDGNNLQFKTIKAGSGVVITNNTEEIQIDATGVGGGEVNTASNLGTTSEGSGVFSTKSGVDLRFKRIQAGYGVNITETANSIQINTSGAGAGITGGQNLGVTPTLPVNVFKNVSGTTMRFRTIASSGTNISVTESNDVITINSPNSIVGAKTIDGATGEASVLSPSPITNGILELKKVKAGKGISLADGAKDVIISNVGPAWLYINSSYAATGGDYIAADTSLGPISVFLPVSPSKGDCINVIDAASTWALNNLTIEKTDPQTIEGLNENLTCNVNGNAALKLFYNGATWKVFV